MSEQNHILHESWELKSTESEVKEVCGKLLNSLKMHEFGEETVFAIHLALEEAFINAVKHGNHDDPEKKIFVECLITPEKFDISIADEGFGFDPDGVPDPRCDSNLYKSNGRGVLLIQSYMDQVEYNDRGNCIHMVKFRNSPGAKAPEKKCS